MLLSFTSKLGSLLHPLAFGVILPLWAVTWVLGYKARQARKLTATGSASTGSESAPLLGSTTRQLLQLRAKRLHHKLAATLLFLTVLTMFVGMYNTYCRAGRLFPGPHMYGGFFLVLVLAFNASLVPFLGERDGVRNLHVVGGLTAVALVVNQVWSGLPILRSVWKGVPW